MLITRKSLITGKNNTLFFNITHDILERIDNRRTSGEMLQNIVPDMPLPMREFFISGMTPTEWVKEFGDFNGSNAVVIAMLGNPGHDHYGSEEIIF